MSAPNRAAARRGGRAKPPPAPAAFNTEEYVFEHNGEPYRLPSFASLRSGLIRRIRNMDEADAFYTVLEEVAAADALAATDDMTIAELAELMKGWQAHASVGLGESSRSSA